MRVTIEIPDALYRRAKSKAAERGQTLTALVTEALQDTLAAMAGGARNEDPQWMRGFGKLRWLHSETARVQARIDEVFEVPEPLDRA